MTNDIPFIDKDNSLIKSTFDLIGKDTLEEASDKFKYLGCGCFNIVKIIFNSNNSKFYVTRPPEFDFETDTGELLIDGGKSLLDINTMTVITEIDIKSIIGNSNAYLIFPYSEDLFCIIDLYSDKDYNGFYNKDDKKVIDLSDYNLASSTYTGGSSLKQYSKMDMQHLILKIPYEHPHQNPATKRLLGCFLVKFIKEYE